MDMSYKANSMSYKINQITLKIPLQIQTIQPKKYLQRINEVQSGDGHLLPILINYKVAHTLTFRKIILPMIIPMNITYSPTYPSVESDGMRHSVYNIDLLNSNNVMTYILPLWLGGFEFSQRLPLCVS